jgi:hypothetical protein
MKTHDYVHRYRGYRSEGAGAASGSTREMDAPRR